MVALEITQISFSSLPMMRDSAGDKLFVKTDTCCHPSDFPELVPGKRVRIRLADNNPELEELVSRDLVVAEVLGSRVILETGPKIRLRRSGYSVQGQLLL